jgi:uncharacterized protein YpmB
MNLSRSDKVRRLPSLSLIRWLVIIAGFILFVIVSFVLYIRSADAGHRHGEKKAYQIALNQGGMEEVSRASIHTWDETVWVVKGKDSEDQPWMIWVRNEELIKKKISEGISEEQMLEEFTKAHSGQKPLRILPGWFQNQPVWEIRYKIDTGDPEDDHQSIDFYSFEDGTKLQTFWLSN